MYVLLHTWYCACWYRFDFVRVFTHDLIFVRDVSPNLILYVLLHTIWFLYLIFVRAFTGTHDLIYIRDFTTIWFMHVNLHALKLVFSSTDIAGSISWFSLLILLKCKSCVNIPPISLCCWLCRSLKLVFPSIDIAGSIS